MSEIDYNAVITTINQLPERYRLAVVREVIKDMLAECGEEDFADLCESVTIDELNTFGILREDEFVPEDPGAVTVTDQPSNAVDGLTKREVDALLNDPLKA